MSRYLNEASLTLKSRGTTSGRDSIASKPILPRINGLGLEEQSNPYKEYMDPQDKEVQRLQKHYNDLKRRKEEEYHKEAFRHAVMSIPRVDYFPTTELVRINSQFKSTNRLDTANRTASSDLMNLQEGQTLETSRRTSQVSIEPSQTHFLKSNSLESSVFFNNPVSDADLVMVEKRLKNAYKAAENGDVLALYKYFRDVNHNSRISSTYSEFPSHHDIPQESAMSSAKTNDSRNEPIDDDDDHHEEIPSTRPIVKRQTSKFISTYGSIDYSYHEPNDDASSQDTGPDESSHGRRRSSQGKTHRQSVQYTDTDHDLPDNEKEDSVELLDESHFAWTNMGNSSLDDFSSIGLESLQDNMADTISPHQKHQHQQQDEDSDRSDSDSDHVILETAPTALEKAVDDEVVDETDRSEDTPLDDNRDASSVKSGSVKGDIGIESNAVEIASIRSKQSHSPSKGPDDAHSITDHSIIEQSNTIQDDIQSQKSISSSSRRGPQSIKSNKSIQEPSKSPISPHSPRGDTVPLISLSPSNTTTRDNETKLSPTNDNLQSPVSVLTALSSPGSGEEVKTPTSSSKDAMKGKISPSSSPKGVKSSKSPQSIASSKKESSKASVASSKRSPSKNSPKIARPNKSPSSISSKPIPGNAEAVKHSPLKDESDKQDSLEAEAITLPGTDNQDDAMAGEAFPSLYAQSQEHSTSRSSLIQAICSSYQDVDQPVPLIDEEVHLVAPILDEAAQVDDDQSTAFDGLHDTNDEDHISITNKSPSPHNISPRISPKVINESIDKGVEPMDIIDEIIAKVSQDSEISPQVKVSSDSPASLTSHKDPSMSPKQSVEDVPHEIATDDSKETQSHFPEGESSDTFILLSSHDSIEQKTKDNADEVIAVVQESSPSASSASNQIDPSNSSDHQAMPTVDTILAYECPQETKTDPPMQEPHPMDPSRHGPEQSTPTTDDISEPPASSPKSDTKPIVDDSSNRVTPIEISADIASFDVMRHIGRIAEAIAEEATATVLTSFPSSTTSIMLQKSPSKSVGTPKSAVLRSASSKKVGFDLSKTPSMKKTSSSSSRRKTPKNMSDEAKISPVSSKKSTSKESIYFNEDVSINSPKNESKGSGSYACQITPSISQSPSPKRSKSISPSKSPRKTITTSNISSPKVAAGGAGGAVILLPTTPKSTRNRAKVIKVNQATQYEAIVLTSTAATSTRNLSGSLTNRSNATSSRSELYSRSSSSSSDCYPSDYDDTDFDDESVLSYDTNCTFCRNSSFYTTDGSEYSYASGEVTERSDIDEKRGRSPTKIDSQVDVPISEDGKDRQEALQEEIGGEGTITKSKKVCIHKLRQQRAEAFNKMSGNSLVSMGDAISTCTNVALSPKQSFSLKPVKRGANSSTTATSSKYEQQSQKKQALELLESNLEIHNLQQAAASHAIDEKVLENESKASLSLDPKGQPSIGDIPGIEAADKDPSMPPNRLNNDQSNGKSENCGSVQVDFDFDESISPKSTPSTSIHSLKTNGHR